MGDSEFARIVFVSTNSGSHNRIEIASEIANKRNLVSLGL